jgi:glycosyltransferase involved in cell wall biosynthesis
MIKKPEITVLMPVKNGEKYIEEAIDSVLKQSFVDFELLIIDDGSDDNTVEIIQKYTDSRIRLVKRASNFIKNLNEGLEIARGNYIARMDADDIMHSERLRIQLKRMKKNPEITVCGTWAKSFSTDGKSNLILHLGDGIIENPMLKLLGCNIMIHPTVMMNKLFLTENKIIYSEYFCVEDYKLWFDIAKCSGTLFVEPQELLFYRTSEIQVTKLNKDEMRKQSDLLRIEILDYLLSYYQSKALDGLYLSMKELEDNGLIVYEDIFRLFLKVFNKYQTDKRS